MRRGNIDDKEKERIQNMGDGRRRSVEGRCKVD